MKKYLIVCLFVSAWLCGCGLTPQAVAYKSLASVGYTVDGAMKSYAIACHEGKVTAEQQKKIDYIHDMEFNPAYNLAVTAAKQDYTALAPADVSAIASKLVVLIDQLVHPKPITQ